MDRLATRDFQYRAKLFSQTSDKIELDPPLVEKDFWVCWILKHLFAMPALRDRIIFKGGTTLSKVYGIIQRFSEDVDLTLDRRLFGIEGEADPGTATGTKERDRRLKAMGKACGEYVQRELRERILAEFATVLGEPGDGWQLVVDTADADGQSLLFRYPEGVEIDSSSAYVAPIVKLEFGSRGEPWPTQVATVQPYAAEAFPGVFGEPSCSVVALTAERTFWEKATILHQEFHRPAGTAMPARLSRHYYDLAMLAKSPVKDRALADPGLLERVVRHKMEFFRCGWAKYEKARPGSFRLVPGSERLQALRRDYAAMQLMIFGESPTLDSVLEALAVLEATINRCGIP